MPVDSELETAAVEASEQPSTTEPEPVDELVEEVSIDGMCGVY